MHTNTDNLTKENALFYMDMVDSRYYPNFQPQKQKRKQLKDMLICKNADYERFVDIYSIMNYILSEREIVVLSELYGLHKERAASMKQVADQLGISLARVMQIRNVAENKIVLELKEFFSI